MRISDIPPDLLAAVHEDGLTVEELARRAARLHATREAFGLVPEQPPAPAANCLTCGQLLRRKPRVEFHGLRVIDGSKSK